MNIPNRDPIVLEPADVVQLSHDMLPVIWEYGSATVEELAEVLGISVYWATQAFCLCLDEKLVSQSFARCARRHPSEPEEGKWRGWQARDLFRLTAKGVRQLNSERSGLR